MVNLRMFFSALTINNFEPTDKGTYNTLLKMSTWGSKHVEEKSILWINNNQCIKLVINI